MRGTNYTCCWRRMSPAHRAFTNHHTQKIATSRSSISRTIPLSGSPSSRVKPTRALLRTAPRGPRSHRTQNLIQAKKLPNVVRKRLDRETRTASQSPSLITKTPTASGHFQFSLEVLSGECIRDAPPKKRCAIQWSTKKNCCFVGMHSAWRQY